MFENDSNRVSIFKMKACILQNIEDMEDILLFWDSFPGIPGFSGRVLIKKPASVPDVILRVPPKLRVAVSKN